MNDKNFILPQSTQLERKQLLIETLLNNTTKVSKVSENSVLSGMVSGISRLTGRTEKDIIIYFSKLHPDYTSGDDLDSLANLYGYPGRLGSSRSSTYILLIADPGTEYLQATHTFISDGATFELSEDITIGDSGYQYVAVRSIQSGEVSNVTPFAIKSVSTEPVGHKSVYNELLAVGGRDLENDEQFRQRIKDGINILSQNTLKMLEQRLVNINNNILKIYHQGLSDQGRIIIGVTTQNGIELNSSEFLELKNGCADFLALTDYRQLSSGQYTIEFRNVEFTHIDVSLNVDFDGFKNYDDVRIDLQTRMLKYLDWRNWKPNQKVEWDNLLQIAKSTSGIRYVQDQEFLPRVDIKVEKNKLPRLRSFILKNLKGELVSSSTESPLFYQNDLNSKLITI